MAFLGDGVSVKPEADKETNLAARAEEAPQGNFFA